MKSASPPPLSVFVFTTSFPRWDGDDAGIFVQRLVAAVGKLGIEETVFVPRDALESPNETMGDYQVNRFRYSLRRGRLAFGAGIMPNIRREPTSILQAPGLLAGFVASALRRERCHVVHANWLVTSLPAYAYSLIARVPYVVTARGEDIKLLRKRAARALLRVPLSRASAVVAVSNSVADELRVLLPDIERKISVIPNGVESREPSEREIQRVRDERTLAKGVHYITFVGSVIPRKRIDDLLRVMKFIDRTDTVLLIAGRLDDHEYVDRVRKLSKELDIEGSVRFEGVVPPKDIAVLLAMSSVYVTASEYEGRPNSVLEAMAAGTPVVASTISAHAEILRHEESGILCSSPEEMGKAVAKLLENTSLRDAMGEAAKRSVEHLSWKRSAQAYRDLFVSIHRSSSSIEIDAPHRHTTPH